MSEEVHIKAVRLSKWYGKVTALQDVSLYLGPGIWGLLGPNGSGKTTFLRLCAGEIRPNLGRVEVCGLRPFANSRALARIGLCPEADALYDELTALELVTALAELSGYPSEEARERAVASLDAFGLKASMDRPMGTYSRGMRQRAKLAQSIVHDPDVLLLDEPLTGTDPASRAMILDQVRARAEAGAVVLFSTHVLHEVETLTENVLLIARGQVVAQGNVHEIREMMEEHPHHIRVRCDRPRDFAAELLRAETGVVGLRFLDEQTVEFQTSRPDETYLKVGETAVEGGYHLRSLTSPDAGLEALFHHLVEKAGSMAGTGADAGKGKAKEMGQGPGYQAAGYQAAMEPGKAPKKRKKKDAGSGKDASP